MDAIISGVLQDRELDRQLYRKEEKEKHDKKIKDIARKERLERKDTEGDTQNNGNTGNTVNNGNIVNGGTNGNKKLLKKTTAVEHDRVDVDILALGAVVCGTLCVLDERRYRIATAAALVQQPME